MIIFYVIGSYIQTMTNRKYPIMICSAGHLFTKFYYEWNLDTKKWQTCKIKYCNRRLYNIDLIIEREYNKHFTRYIHGDHKWFSMYEHEKAPRGDSKKTAAVKMKERMRSLLLSGTFIKCGYCTTAVRGYYTYYIFSIS